MPEATAKAPGKAVQIIRQLLAVTDAQLLRLLELEQFIHHCPHHLRLYVNRMPLEVKINYLRERHRYQAFHRAGVFRSGKLQCSAHWLKQGLGPTVGGAVGVGEFGRAQVAGRHLGGLFGGHVLGLLERGENLVDALAIYPIGDREVILAAVWSEVDI